MTLLLYMQIELDNRKEEIFVSFIEDKQNL